MFEAAAQVTLLVAYWVDWLFTEHLLLGNVFSAALLLGLANWTIQIMDIYLWKSGNSFDSAQNYRSMKVGSVLGVFNHLWYAFLDVYLDSRELAIVFKKIALDQAIAGPFFSSAFIVGMGILEGNSLHSVYEDWKQKFLHIYMVDWMFWPLAQFINFFLVPYRFRVFYVNIATFLWNTFLCYVKHQSKVEVNPGRESPRALAQRSTRDLHLIQNSPEKERSGSPWSKRKRLPSVSKPGSQNVYHTKQGPSIKSTVSKYRHRKTSSPGRFYQLPNSSQLTIFGEKQRATERFLKLFLESINRSSLCTLKEETHDPRSICAPAIWHTTNAADGVMSIESSSNSCSCTSLKASITSKVTANVLPRASQNSLVPKPPARALSPVKRGGTFAKVQSKIPVPSRQPSALNDLSQKQKVVPKNALALCRPTAAFRRPVKGQVAQVDTENIANNVPKSPLLTTSQTAGGPRRVLAWNSTASSRNIEKELKDIRKEIKGLKNFMTTSQRDIPAVVSEAQSQFARLEELCALIYISVDTGSRCLAHKADELAGWLTMEKQFMSAEQIRDVVKEVMSNEETKT